MIAIGAIRLVMSLQHALVLLPSIDNEKLQRSIKLSAK